MDSKETIEQKLEQIDKIIRICLQSSVTQLGKDQNNNPCSPESNSTAVFKLFAKQLTLLKQHSKDSHANLYSKYPNLKKWLQLVNVPESLLNEMDFSRVTFHDLFCKERVDEVRACLSGCGPSLEDKEISKVLNGFQCLRQLSNPDMESAQNMANSSTNNSISQSVSSTSSSTSSVLTGQQSMHGKQSVPEINSSNSVRVKQQRKSESDVQFNSVNSSNGPKQLKPLTNNQYSTSTNNFSNLSSTSSSSSNKKNNFTFSPTLPVKSKKGSKVTTPPPFRKNSTGNPINQVNLNNPQLAALAAVLAKTNTQNKNPPSESTSNMQRSSSHESHLRNKIQIVHQNDAPSSSLQTAGSILENKAEDNCFLATGDRRLSNSDKCGSELSSRCPSGQASPSLQSPGRFSKASNSMTNSIESKSPKVNREHRWTNAFKVTNCSVCGKKLIFGVKCKNCKNIKKCMVCHKPVWHGLKCKYCKFRCHKDCEKKVAQFCSVNSMSYFTNDLPVISVADNTEQPKFVQYSNTSSAASSTTASPALHNLNQSQLSESSTFNYSPSNSLTSAVFGFTNKIVNSKNSTPITNHKPVKCVKDPHFIDSRSSSSCNSSEPNSPNYFKQIHNQQFNPHKLNTSDKKPSFSSISNASMGFFNTSQAPNQLVSSVTSTTTQNTLTASDNPQDSPKTESENAAEDEDETVTEDSKHFAQNSELQQFNIQYEEITQKTEIGRGRFGIVYKAYWHGEIASKEVTFNQNISEDSEELVHFKEEVSNLRKTRHSNLILFIGAYIKPPKCAIVMSLCRSPSLYKYLHTESVSSGNKVNLDWIIDICTQIAQAMGYLHNKQMIHKDLRSKNVFIDGNKAVITDFGLYSIRRLCNRLKRDDLLPITKECLYYMAPELVKLIGTGRIEAGFSQASDVYAFGTIWYEMFCHEFPFSSYSTDSVLYLVGNGLKNLSPNIQLSKEFKIILLKCWSKDPSNRPDFSRLLETFRGIPKKSKLFRSPSHPVHINMR